MIDAFLIGKHLDRYSLYFIPAGAEAYERDVPDAEVVLLFTGHFALVEEVDAIARHVERSLHRAFAT